MTLPDDAADAARALGRWEEDGILARDAEPALWWLAQDYVGGRSGSIQSLYDGPVEQQQRFLLKLEDTVELALINSREYQSVREDLYLAALPVTQQRFSFAWQWAAIENAVRQWAGPNSLVGHQNSWSLGSAVSASKLFSTGALLTMSFANNTVFNFLNGANGFTSASTINLNFVQPLLQDVKRGRQVPHIVRRREQPIEEPHALVVRRVGEERAGLIRGRWHAVQVERRAANELGIVAQLAGQRLDEL